MIMMPFFLTCFVADWFVQLDRLVTDQLYFLWLPEHGYSVLLAYGLLEINAANIINPNSISA